MSTGLHYLDVGPVAAAFAGILWWMIAQSTKSRAQRTMERIAKQAGVQPWSNDRAGGRGNR